MRYIGSLPRSCCSKILYYSNIFLFFHIKKQQKQIQNLFSSPVRGLFEIRGFMLLSVDVWPWCLDYIRSTLNDVVLWNFWQERNSCPFSSSYISPWSLLFHRIGRLFFCWKVMIISDKKSPNHIGRLILTLTYDYIYRHSLIKRVRTMREWVPIKLGLLLH